MDKKKVQLGDFLLAGHWLSFPGLSDSRKFVFAFPSAQARTAFIKTWAGTIIVLPGKNAPEFGLVGEFLIDEKGMEKTTRDGAFLLTISPGAHSEQLQKLIYDKLIGKGTGHTVWDIMRYTKKHGCEVNEDVALAEINAMIASGTLERDVYYGHDVYRHTTRSLRVKRSIDEDGAIRGKSGRAI